MQPFENFSPEEVSRMEAETIKLKLIAEHGAPIHISEGNPLSAEMELAWLNHIMNYEQLCKEAGESAVFDFIGKPAYRKAEEMNTGEIAKELENLLSYMYERGISLNFDDDEEPHTIYRFITEELFIQTVNCYLGPGGEGHRMFDYYEFHPNHLKDLTRYCEEYLRNLIDKPDWDGKYLDFTHEKSVWLNGHELSLDEYSLKIDECKKNVFKGQLIWEIQEVVIEIESKKAEIKVFVKSDVALIIIKLSFVYDFLWTISGVEWKNN